MAVRTDDAAARRITEKLGWLGVFDPAANTAGNRSFSAAKPGCRPCGPDGRRADDRTAYTCVSAETYRKIRHAPRDAAAI